VKKKKVFLLYDFPDTFSSGATNIDVVTSENEKFGDLPQKYWEPAPSWMADDPIQSWLH